MEVAVFMTTISYGISVILICFASDVKIEKSNHKKSLIIKDSFKDFSNVKWILVFVISIAIISEISYGISINLGQIHFEEIGFNIKYLGYISAFSEILGILSCKTYILSEKFGQNKTLKFMLNIMLICVAILIFTRNIFISIATHISIIFNINFNVNMCSYTYIYKKYIYKYNCYMSFKWINIYCIYYSFRY